MDMWTKIFLINWVLILFASTVDKKVLSDAIEKNKITGPLLDLWVVLSLVSVPAWLIRLIIIN